MDEEVAGPGEVGDVHEAAVAADDEGAAAEGVGLVEVLVGLDVAGDEADAVEVEVVAGEVVGGEGGEGGEAGGPGEAEAVAAADEVAAHGVVDVADAAVLGGVGVGVLGEAKDPVEGAEAGLLDGGGVGGVLLWHFSFPG